MRRLTHAERKQRTHSSLVATARAVFLEHGFHGASLDEIAERAGYSKGAVYSNFKGKDELFLSVLDAHFEQRAGILADVVLEHEDLDDSLRAVAQSIAKADEDEPRWTPLLLEFWSHASRRPQLRAVVAERRERFLGIVAGLIEQLGSRHGIEFAIPAIEVARGTSALARGMALERLINPEHASADLFAEMHTAYVKGLVRVPAGASLVREERSVR